MVCLATGLDGLLMNIELSIRWLVTKYILPNFAIIAIIEAHNVTAHSQGVAQSERRAIPCRVQPIVNRSM